VKSIAEGLSASGVEIDLFSLNTTKHHTTLVEIDAFRYESSYKNIKYVDIDTSESPLGALNHLLFRSGTYFVDRFYKKEVSLQLLEQLKSIDYNAILIESLYMAPYIDTIVEFDSSIPIVLRAHNIEFELRERQQIKEGLLKRFYLKSEIRKLRNYELSAFSKVDLVVTVSRREEEKIRGLNSLSKVMSIPIGMDTTQEVEDKRSKDCLTIGFIGSLDWKPNIQGLQWFVESVWHSIQEIANVECLVAGSYAKGQVDFLQGKRLKSLGTVESSKDFLNSIDVLIVPLFAGSGTRVKILEAMSIGVAVMSTPLGAEGIDVQHNRDIIIAETKDEWISAISQCVTDPNHLSQIRLNALALIKENYNIDFLGRKLKLEVLKVHDEKSKLKTPN